jgi:ferrous iron transport protein B
VNQKRKIALVGTPNAGKTALFNILTSSHQRVANYSGVTVESAEADLILPNGDLCSLIDLPGSYSLRPYTEEETVLTQALERNAFDGMIIVVDATQPERAMRFLVEVLDATDQPAVVALNMADLAKARGFEYDFIRFAESMGVPVIPTVAVKRGNFSELLQALEKAIHTQKRTRNRFMESRKVGGEQQTQKEVSEQILSFYKKSDALVKDVLMRKGRPDTRSEKIDRIVLHPVWGLFILLAVLGITFQLMFNLAQYPMDLIDGAFGWMGAHVNALDINPMVKSFLADGVIAGIGGTLVFLPQILILFALILFLEDFGFMARAVFLLDYWMGKVGLHGRSFLPLISSYACAVPGIMATRAIESKRDRLITTMIIPITTCSARVPVYTLLISAFIPNIAVGFFGVKLQGLVMLALYVIGIVFALIVGGIMKKFFFKGKRPPLLIELPSYKMPSFQSLFKGLVYRGKLFLNRVGTIILALTIVIWFLVSFPKAPEGTEHPIEYSYAAQVGHVFEPVLKPLGFDWKIGMALVPTFAAREVMVATLSTVYAVGDESGVSDTDKLSDLIKHEWPLATGLSLMAWFIFAPMCISTLAVARRELKSTKWMLIMTVYLFVLAYIASYLTNLFALKYLS